MAANRNSNQASVVIPCEFMPSCVTCTLVRSYNCLQRKKKEIIQCACKERTTALAHYEVLVFKEVLLLLVFLIRLKVKDSMSRIFSNNLRDRVANKE